jgi:hypothetical protein
MSLSHDFPGQVLARYASSWKNESSFPASNFWYSAVVALDEKKTKKKHFEVFQLEKRELIPSFKLLVFRGLG